MISLTASDTNNGVNRAEGQQPEPSLYPATSTIKKRESIEKGKKEKVS